MRLDSVLVDHDSPIEGTQCSQMMGRRRDGQMHGHYVRNLRESGYKLFYQGAYDELRTWNHLEAAMLIYTPASTLVF